MMDYQHFYAQLFAPLVDQIGAIDRETIFAIIGFDCGGPLNFSTIGSHRQEGFVTYISCELAVRKEQKPCPLGRYELLCSCDDESWVRSIVTDIARESLETRFAHGHSLDIGAWVEPSAVLQAVVLENVCQVKIEQKLFGILRIIGITRPELEYKMEHGFDKLLIRLKKSGVYPNTSINRASVV
jgi:Suppressor of fused protein (SUFU)